MVRVKFRPSSGDALRPTHSQGTKGRIMRYRKKPVVIEAFVTDEPMDIETLEGTTHASAGDYIITGVEGERYPCKPDIFEKTYESADAAPLPVDRDALLGLAEEMDVDAGCHAYVDDYVVYDYARRIREALGE